MSVASRLAVIAATLAAAGLMLASRACADETVTLADAYLREVRPLLANYCYECHSADTSEAHINFEAFQTLKDARAAVTTWHRTRSGPCLTRTTPARRSSRRQ